MSKSYRFMLYHHSNRFEFGRKALCPNQSFGEQDKVMLWLVWKRKLQTELVGCAKEYLSSQKGVFWNPNVGMLACSKIACKSSTTTRQNKTQKTLNPIKKNIMLVIRIERPSRSIKARRDELVQAVAYHVLVQYSARSISPLDKWWRLLLWFSFIHKEKSPKGNITLQKF